MNYTKKIITFILLALPAILLYNCANPVSPNGGPRDEEAPQVLSSEPPNHSIFFDKNRISINFNEYVKLKNPQKQVLISPPFATKPEYKLRGKTLVIDIEEELYPNTTYTIFFGDAIVDITEENPLTNYLYAFSTGGHVDSLAIGGEIVNAFDLKPREDIFVMLFPESIDTIPQDSIPMQSRPLYVARTDVNGQFQLHNLRNERYRLFAINDVNGNYMFDQPNEEIAFLDSLVSPELPELPAPPAPDTTLQNDSLHVHADSTHHDSILIQNIYDHYYQLYMFQQVDSTQRLLSLETFYPSKFRIIYQFPADTPKFEVINKNPGDDWKIEQLNRNRDTLTVWLKDMNLDSLQITIADGKQILDTTWVSFTKEKEEAEKKISARKKDEEFVERIKIKTNGRGSTLDLGKPLRLIMGNPLKSWDFSTTQFVAGKDTMNGAPFKVKDSIATVFELDYEILEMTNYSFIFPDSVFKSIYGLTNDSLQASFTSAEFKDYGNLLLNVETGGELPYILQLQDSKERLLKEYYISESRELKIEFLKPGTYLLKAIQDRWANKKWDTGVYVETRQPENIFYFPVEIQIRANWDVDETWKLP